MAEVTIPVVLKPGEPYKVAECIRKVSKRYKVS